MRNQWWMPRVAHFGKDGGGGGSGKTQTVVNKTELPQWVTDAAQKNLNQSYTVSDNLMAPYSGQRVADMQPGQLSAIQALLANIGSTNPAFAQAQNAAGRVSGYNPMMVGAQQIGADYEAERVNPGSYSAAMISNPGSVTADQVRPGFLSGMDLSSYMNPYTRDVIGSGMQAIDVQRQQAQNQNADAAIKAGAFGGGRHGIVEGTTNAGAATSAGRLASELMAQNFGQAQAAAQGDLARSLQAQGMNQGANLQAGTTSLQAALQAALANQVSSNQAGQFNTGLNFQGQTANQAAALQAAQLNQQARMANQSSALQAAQGNQQAGLAGAGLNLNAANSMGNLAAQGQSSFLQGASAGLAGQDALQGHQQQLLDALRSYYGEQQQFPLQQLQIPLQALGMTPYGQTNTQTGPAPERGSSSGFLSGLGGASAGVGILGGLNSLIPGGFAALLGSDEREKVDIVKQGKDKNTGLNIYAYRYRGDPKDYPKVVGPMAQEIEKKFPDQVTTIGGRKAVNASFLSGMMG
jgi:hypothetical protein